MYDILDANGQVVLKIRGPCCACQTICCTGDVDFEVRNITLKITNSMLESLRGWNSRPTCSTVLELLVLLSTPQRFLDGAIANLTPTSIQCNNFAVNYWWSMLCRAMISCLSPDARISSTYNYRGTRCLHRILAGQLSSGKLGGQEVKTSALVSRRSWVRIACEVFSTDTRKALSIQCYTHVGVGQN